MFISTRTKHDTMGRTYEVDKAGNIVDEKSVASTIGTTVVATKLFHNVPVRRQKISKNLNASVRKVHQLVSRFDFSFLLFFHEALRFLCCFYEDEKQRVFDGM